MSNFTDVLRFMNAVKQPVRSSARWPDEATVKLRVELIREEFEELKEAIEKGDLVGVCDALTDILVVTYGAGGSFGLNLDASFKEVDRSNCSKLDDNGMPIVREDGKVMKGPNYSPPDLWTIVMLQDRMPDWRNEKKFWNRAKKALAILFNCE